MIRQRGCSACSGAELCRSCVPLAHQHTLFQLQWLFTVCLSYGCSQFAYHVIAQIAVSHFVSIIVCFIMKKAPSAPPPARAWRELAPCTSATCNAISDKRRCDFKISHGEIVSMDHSLHYFYLFLSHFVHFSSIKNMLYCKEISAEQNAGHVQLCHYFIWQVMTACLINVVIDNGCLSICCTVALKLQTVQCKPYCSHFPGYST